MRETASSVCHVVSGKGQSKIGNETIHWEAEDASCIPAWHHYQHIADESEDVYLYSFHDKPMLSALGFYRAEGVDSKILVSE